MEYVCYTIPCCTKEQMPPKPSQFTGWLSCCLPPGDTSCLCLGAHPYLMPPESHSGTDVCWDTVWLLLRIWGLIERTRKSFFTGKVIDKHSIADTKASGLMGLSSFIWEGSLNGRESTSSTLFLFVPAEQAIFTSKNDNNIWHYYPPKPPTL